MKYKIKHRIVDEQLLDDILLLADIEPNETVMEIRTGTGELTASLCEIANEVVVFEHDPGLKPSIEELMERYDNLKVVQGNVLKARIPKVDRIISNIPFQITEPFVTRLFNGGFRSATLLVGSTYGREAISEEPTSRLGILTQAHFRIEYLRDVKRTSFNPPPGTDCSLITLRPAKKREMYSLRLFLIRSLWEHRSRSLQNALEMAIREYGEMEGCSSVNPMAFIYEVREHYPRSLGGRVSSLTSFEFEQLYAALGEIRVSRAFGGHKPRGGARSWRVEYAEYLENGYHNNIGPTH